MLHFPRHFYRIIHYFRYLQCFCYAELFGDWVMDDFGTAVKIDINQADHYLLSNDYGD